MTYLYCFLAFIAGLEARKPVIAFCMRSVAKMKRRIYQVQTENNQLRKKLKQYENS